MSRQSSPDRYAVLACSGCHDYYLTGDPGTHESITCPHCGVSRHPNQIRKVGEHPEREGAAELRARQLAQDAENDVEYGALDDYGVLGDQIQEQDTPIVEPPADSPCDTEFFAAAAADALEPHRTTFEQTPKLEWENWFAEAGDEASVDHPNAAVVDECAEQRLARWREDHPEAPTTGSLSISLDTHISPTVSLELSDDDDLLAPTTLQKRLFDPDSPLVDSLRDALQNGAPDYAHRLYDSGVTALDGAYARIASNALQSGDDDALWRLLATTRSLGGQTPLHIRSSLDDIERGPVALFAIADVTPLIEITINDSFFEVKSTRRKRFLAHLHRLTPGVDVRITGSRLCLRQLLARHGDDLPASVSEDAHQRLRSRETASTITEQRAQAALDALEELGVDHPAWEVLVSLSAARREMRSYSALYADGNFSDVTQSALRRRLKRLRDADLIETPTRNGDSYARLTPIGHAALDKHPELTAASDVSASPDAPSSSADWSTGHTEQPESPDGSPVSSTVSDPRNSPASTVLPQHAREGGDRPAAGDNRSSSGTSSYSSRSSSSSPSTQYLSLADHHATAAAASAGQFALVERSLPETAAHRDHRGGRFSHDPDRGEVVVSIDYSPSIALTAVRLCSALLSDKAFNQVLTPERLAGDPDGMSLDGLLVSTPCVLRDAACIGWLRDEDATGTGLCDRLEQARRDLLAMTGDLYDEEGINGDVASELLRMAHGLMGVALRLYDLLEIDVVREIQFPAGAPDDDESRRNLRTFLAVASSVGGRYGAYSAHRVLHEPRPEKREQLLSEPNVDPADPEGTLLGPWVLTGEGVEDLEDVISQSGADLELQEDGAKFAPFVLEGAVVDGNRRRAIAEAVTRMLSFKEGLRPERQAISVLAGLSSDIFAATEAVGALGGEDEPREMDMQDVRYGLSQLSWRRILPEMGGDVVSKVVAALLDAQERVSTADLAELAGCSTRSLSTAANERRFAELESLGLLDRDDQGSGKATLWRLRLPFRVERHDGEPLPRMLVGEKTTPTGGEWHLSNGVNEVLLTSADEYNIDYTFEFGGKAARSAFWGPPPIDRDLEPLVSVDASVEPLVSLLAHLLDQGGRYWGTADRLSLGTVPDPQQSTLGRAVS